MVVLPWDVLVTITSFLKDYQTLKTLSLVCRDLSAHTAARVSRTFAVVYNESHRGIPLFFHLKDAVNTLRRHSRLPHINHIFISIDRPCVTIESSGELSDLFIALHSMKHIYRLGMEVSSNHCAELRSLDELRMPPSITELSISSIGGRGNFAYPDQVFWDKFSPQLRKLHILGTPDNTTSNHLFRLYYRRLAFPSLELLHTNHLRMVSYSSQYLPKLRHLIVDSIDTESLKWMDKTLLKRDLGVSEFWSQLESIKFRCITLPTEAYETIFRQTPNILQITVQHHPLYLEKSVESLKKLPKLEYFEWRDLSLQCIHANRWGMACDHYSNEDTDGSFIDDGRRDSSVWKDCTALAEGLGKACPQLKTLVFHFVDPLFMRDGRGLPSGSSDITSATCITLNVERAGLAMPWSSSAQLQSCLLQWPIRRMSDLVL